MCSHILQVTDPTTDDMGAGAGSNFRGGEDAQRNFKQTAGVIEGRPGIIESTNIDPLNEDSNKGEHILRNDDRHFPHHWPREYRRWMGERSLNEQR